MNAQKTNIFIMIMNALVSLIDSPRYWLDMTITQLGLSFKKNSDFDTHIVVPISLLAGVLLGIIAIVAGNIAHISYALLVAHYTAALMYCMERYSTRHPANLTLVIFAGITAISSELIWIVALILMVIT